MTISTIIDNFSHSRRFGIELEFFNVSHLSLMRALSQGGIRYWNVYGERCDDTECPGDCSVCANVGNCENGWKITNDGSISGGNSVELVSPILSGIAGLREVAKVVKLVAALGAKVNKSCGFHVHVDAQDLSAQTMFNVYRRYALHESQIDTFMVPSRRASVNNFCRSTTAFLGQLAEANHDSATCSTIASIMEDERWVNGIGYIGGRYNKVNLCAFLRHGTIEFRHHAGTMNVNKVINWIAFCVNFVEVSVDTDTADIFTGVHPDSVQFFNHRATELT